ncbi:MAG: orotate phosphoribosyltransferase [Gemmatimonadota bacterium]|nr:orotate phosphoribosyltransferase [Gemmatimonadota bacterium]
MNRKAIAELLLNIRAVTINVEAPYHYRSGIISPIYCDNRLMISYPDERSAVVDGLVGIIESQNLKPDIIAGTATAAIPFASWVSDRMNLPMLYVRSGQKGYGKERHIEGVLNEGARVVFTEDLITTGGGVLSAVTYVNQAGGEVVGVAAVFEYGLPTSNEAFEKDRIDRWCLSDFPAILDVMTDRGDLTNEERDIALAWKSDPKGWGRKMGFE